MAPLLPGTTLGDYTIVDLVGGGAMGVVYRARDEQLHRTVAIKVLTDGRTTTLRQQTLHEARAASALNHPGICTIYGVDQVGDHDFIVMEFVDGRRLSEQIPADGLPLDSLLACGIQIADALAHAHEQGVVHRDLKSANVLVTREGRIKVVDFGLAERLEQAPPEAATAAADMGTIGGTLAYMAPEVLQGESPTSASDIWAFGVLLYEAATGTLPFNGRTSFELTALVLRGPFTPLPPHVPVSIRTVIAHCLAKEPAQRYRSAREIRAALEAVRSDAAIVPLRSATAESRLPWLWAAAAIVLAIGAAALWQVWPRSPAAPLGGARIMQLIASERQAYGPALSADGSMVAYVAEDESERFDIFLTRVAGGGRVRVTDDDARESRPRFSPDGDRLVFARRRPDVADPEICVVATLGGQISVVISNAGQPAWSPDGARIAFIRPAAAGAPFALGTAAAGGGDERLLVLGDGVYPSIRNPTWSPDGESIVFVRGTGGVAGELWLVPAAGGSARKISSDPAAVFVDEPEFSHDGRLIVHTSNRGGATNIWALPVDGGAPVRLTTGPGPDESPTVDRAGRVAFTNSQWRSELFARELGGAQIRSLARHAHFLWAPAISPDGREVAFSRGEVDGAWHIWIVAADGGAARQLTFGARGEVYARWTPDGRFVTYQDWAAPRRVWRVPRDGGPSVALTPDDRDAGFAEVSPDGRWLAYTATEPPNERVYIAPLDGSGDARPLVPTAGSLPRWSPDGTWIAYAPDRSYYNGIFVVRPDGTGARRLAAVGGWPVWWPDGRHISYLDTAPDGTQRIQTVTLDGRPPERRIDLPFRGVNHPFDIARDGQWIAVGDAVHVTSAIWVLQQD